MRFQKKTSSGPFLKKGKDILEGQMIEIMSEGEQVEGEFGMQNVFEVETEDGLNGNVSINQTSINGFIDAWGEDSANWVKKKVKVHKVKQNVAGKFIDVYYFSHPDAELTETGFVMTVNQDIPVVEDNGR